MSELLYDLLNHCAPEVWAKLSPQIQKQFVDECFRQMK